MNYIILKLMCITTHARECKERYSLVPSPPPPPPRPGDEAKKDTIPNLQHAVKVVV